MHSVINQKTVFVIHLTGFLCQRGWFGLAIFILALDVFWNKYDYFNRKRFIQLLLIINLLISIRPGPCPVQGRAQIKSKYGCVILLRNLCGFVFAIILLSLIGFQGKRLRLFNSLPSHPIRAIIKVILTWASIFQGCKPIMFIPYGKSSAHWFAMAKRLSD